jgi:pimeloyl-ACP methyl ester carboxylesterase
MNGRILAELIPHAQLEIVRCGHLFLHERPDEMAALIADFTAR